MRAFACVGFVVVKHNHRRHHAQSSPSAALTRVQVAEELIKKLDKDLYSGHNGHHDNSHLGNGHNGGANASGQAPVEHWSDTQVMVVVVVVVVVVVAAAAVVAASSHVTRCTSRVTRLNWRPTSRQ